MTLREAYYNTAATHCAGCGCLLHTMSKGDILSNYFIMDKEANFYCTDCEKDFADGDERIYSPDLDEEKPELSYEMMPVIDAYSLEKALIAKYGPEFADNYGEFTNVLFGDSYVNDSYKSYDFSVIHDLSNLSVWQDETQCHLENLINAYLQEVFPNRKRVLVDVSW
jgi:hypothetical protein